MLNKIALEGFQSGFAQSLMDYAKKNPIQTAIALGSSGVLGSLLAGTLYEEPIKGPTYGFLQGLATPLGAVLGMSAGDYLIPNNPLTMGSLGMTGALGAKKLVDLLYGEDKPREKINYLDLLP